MFSKQILGLWALQSWQLTTASGKVIHPYGENPRGLIHYSGDGFMSVTLEASDRKASGHPALTNLTPDESKNMYENFCSYCGAFEVIDGEVHHHIKHMSFKDWEGKTVVRKVTFDDDNLILSHDIDYQGEKVDSVLIWKKTSVSL